MSLYFDPDSDQTSAGPIFDLPDFLEASCQTEIMHAAAIVIDSFGILLRGQSGSGKSLLQRTLRREAQAMGLEAALVSDDYVKLVRMPAEAGAGADAASQPQLRAFCPVATKGLQEVRGLGIVSVSPRNFVDQAPMHLLVDLRPHNEIQRMPPDEERKTLCLEAEIAHLSVPQLSVLEACDLIFALLSTWKEPL
nr:hypothetical protein [uncultured Cohaesibacter sp.]